MELSIFIDICNNLAIMVSAAAGAMKGIKHRLDLFGVTFLAIITACGGGILRDVIINEIPNALLTPIPLYLAIITSLVLYFSIAKFIKTKRITLKQKNQIYKCFNISILIFDAIALALFTIVGANKGINLQLNIITTAILATLTGVGGGIFRDILISETPVVLKEDIYAILSFVGGALYHIFVLKLEISQIFTNVFVFLIILIVRLIIIKYKINLPKINNEKIL